jgi:hypothetical protein
MELVAQVTQYQSIPKGEVKLEEGKPIYSGQASPKHAGGVIDLSSATPMLRVVFGSNSLPVQRKSAP